MIYIKVRWFHNSNRKYQQWERDPVEIYSELDDERNELRKIEIFRDGKAICISDAGDSNGTGLSIEPIPSLDFINNQREFEATDIKRDDFEDKWRSVISQSD